MSDYGIPTLWPLAIFALIGVVAVAVGLFLGVWWMIEHVAVVVS